MEHPLRILRKRADFSLDRLADETGISKASLSRIETGEQHPSFEVIRALIEFSRQFGPDELTATDFVNFGVKDEAA